MVEDADVVLRIRTSVIRAVGSDGGFRLFEIVAVRRLAIEIPSTKLDAHSDPFSSETPSAPIEDCVHFRRVRLVVHHPAADLDPGVWFERHLPRATHQL